MRIGTHNLRPGKKIQLFAAATLLCVPALLVGCGDDDDNAKTATPSPSAVTSATATPGEGSSSTAPAGTATTPASQPPGTATASTGGTGNGGGSTAELPAAYDDSSSALDMLTSYYNAVNRGEYDRAYGYWRNPSQTFDQFKQGYATTSSVVATLVPASGIDAAAGQRRTLVAAVLSATMKEGSHQSFAGCYVAWHASPGVSANPNDELWHIEEATVGAADANTALRTLIGNACNSYKDRVANFGAAYDDQTGSVDVIASLYDAVNRKDYQRAIGYWEQPPQPLDQFAAGYANTASVTATIGAPAMRRAAAGSVYDSVPIVLHSTDTAGKVTVFSGCYVTRRSNITNDGSDPKTNPWHIYSADIKESSATAAVADLLRHGCDNTP
jgi:hypothetical protein